MKNFYYNPNHYLHSIIQIQGGFSSLRDSAIKAHNLRVALGRDCYDSKLNRKTKGIVDDFYNVVAAPTKNWYAIKPNKKIVAEKDFFVIDQNESRVEDSRIKSKHSTKRLAEAACRKRNRESSEIYAVETPHGTTYVP